MSYHVFVRNWYQRGKDGQLEPNYNARKTTLAGSVSREEAVEMCREYNSTHTPGPLSRKAEFEEN